jgi:hypothetical protein
MMRLQAQAAGHVGNISDAGSRPRRARALVETTMSLPAPPGSLCSNSCLLTVQWLKPVLPVTAGRNLIA